MDAESILESQTAVPQRKFQWRLFFFLCALAIPAGLALVPYSLALTDMSTFPEEMRQTTIAIFMVIGVLLQLVIINWPLTALGLLAADRTKLRYQCEVYRMGDAAPYRRSLLVLTRCLIFLC